MRDNLAEQTIPDIMNKQTDILPETRTATNLAGCGITELVGTVLSRTIGLVIANADNQLHEVMNTDKKYRSIGIPGIRIDAGPQVLAVDEAIKATNNEITPIELARDTEGGGGHGCLIISGVSDVSDVRRVVEVALPEIERTMGDVYGSSAGHLEFQYTARVSYVLNKALGTPIGKSSGMICASPMATGLVIADVATKSAVIDPVGYTSLSQGTSFSNEVIFTFSDDSGAIHQTVTAAREVSLQLFSTLDPVEIKSITTPYT